MSGLGSYPDMLKDIQAQDVNVAIMASKTLLDVAETTQVAEKLQLDVMSQLLQGLASPHTQVGSQSLTSEAHNIAPADLYYVTLT